MITLIHGDDTTASRNYYFELKQQAKDSTILNGVTITQEDLQQALSGNDLFGDSKTIFIEDLLSKRKSQKELDSFIFLLKSSILNPKSVITLWESKELTKKQVESLEKATVKQFKIPSTIFALLDAIKPRNGKQFIELFHKTLNDKDPEFVLVMLQRQVRILLSLCHSERSEESHSISELSRLAPWQKGKLEKQAKQFTLNQLLSLHDALFQLELGMKTGALSSSLENSIDFLLLSL